jgi:TrpR family trp operon transcriptional repressor
MKIDDPRVAENIGELASALAKTQDAALIESFLRGMLTQSEFADIAARWALVKSLKEKKTQREIAKDLGISLCKITRGSRELKTRGEAFQKMFEAAENSGNN